MKIVTKQLAVAALVILVVMTNSVCAQEEEQAKTPQQVVNEFSYALTAALSESRIDPALLNKVVGTKSREALNRWGDRLIGPLGMYLIVPRLVAQEPTVDDDRATAHVVPQLRSLEVKMVKEEGQWKVDLLATLAGLPEPFAVTPEELAARTTGPPGAAAPQPQAGEQPPTTDSGEEGQPSSVVEITMDNFKEQVVEAEIPVLLEFWADGCDGCDDLKSVFDELARDYAGTVRFGSVDVNPNIPLAIAFQAVRIPCLVLFHSGEELARTIGYMNTQELQDWIEANLSEQD
jgi:thioredoxin 1